MCQPKAVLFLLPFVTVAFCFLCRFYKKAAAFVLRAVAKHSPDLAQAVVDSGALDALVPCLEVYMIRRRASGGRGGGGYVL